jgi:hypothetical protein
MYDNSLNILVKHYFSKEIYNNNYNFYVTSALFSPFCLFACLIYFCFFVVGDVHMSKVKMCKNRLVFVIFSLKYLISQVYVRFLCVYLIPGQTRKHCCRNICDSQCFLECFPTCGNIVAETNFASWETRMFPIKFRNIWRFPSEIFVAETLFLRLPTLGTLEGNNVYF